MRSSILRTLIWISFFVTILLAWAWLYGMAVKMDIDVVGRLGPAGHKMAAMSPYMDMPMPMAQFKPLFLMWAIMMAAMMLPVLVPTLITYEALMVSANGTRSTWFGILMGYFVTWIAFSAWITAVQLLLLFNNVIDLYGISKSFAFSGGLLILVGVFQFSRVKDVCHGICITPMAYFMKHWHIGWLAGFRMGLGLGIYCVCCCWGFMVLGFIGGVMNLLWMGLATLLMVLEKLPQVGRIVIKPLGAFLIASGITLVVSHQFSGFHIWL